MSGQVVQIIDTGVANIRSLQAAMSRLGCQWRLTVDPDVVQDSEFVVLPGVGTFGAAIAAIDENELREPIVARILADKPTLAICLGFQMLCSSSEEGEGVKGLGILPNRIERFTEDVQIPQLGWNQVKSSTPGFETGEAYFANSFRLADEPIGWNFAKSDYGGEFFSSFWKSKVLACQFHPELSGEWGQRLMASWLKGAIC